MNPVDDLDRRIERWFGESTPSTAPRSLLDKVLDRTSSLPQRSHRGLRFSPLLKLAGAVVVVALAVAVGFAAGRLITSGIGQAASSPSPSAAATVDPSAAVSPTEEPSATPSPAPTTTPAGDAEVLLAFTQACDVGPPVLLPTTTVFEDGRVVWQENGPGYQWRVRELSATGLETVRARVAATGLLDRNGEYRPELRQGMTEGPPHGVCGFTFGHQDGQTDVSVTSVMWFGDEEEAAYFEPAPERQELDAFAQQLRSPETWLAPNDWANAASAPYVADSYLVLVSEELRQANGPDLEEVDWPFDAPPSTYGEPVDSGGQPQERCAVAPREEVERYVAGQAQPGGEPIDLAAPSTYLNLREGDTWYAVVLWSVPIPTVDCSDVG